MAETTRAGSAAIYDVRAEREVMVPMRPLLDTAIASPRGIVCVFSRVA
jgi:hypothetical protein